jgi:hypothetical protein
VALTSTVKTEIEKNDALQQENNELKVQMKTPGARVGKAAVTVREAFIIARVALPLIERLKLDSTAHKYTRPDIVLRIREPDLFMLVGIKEELEERIHRPVDIVTYRDNMNLFLKKRIDEEAVYA